MPPKGISPRTGTDAVMAPAVVLLWVAGAVAAALAKSAAVRPRTVSVHSAAPPARAHGAVELSSAPQRWPATITETLVDPEEAIDRRAEIARLQQLVSEEVQPDTQSPRPHAAVPGREDGKLLGPLIDPEVLFEDETTPWQGLAARASPSPVPSGQQTIAEPEVLLKSDRGVLLSVPLSPAEQAKAASEIVKTLCDNTCGLSYDGICSDGVASTSFCSGEEAFPAAGRGSCRVAEGSECELGTDCAPAAHLTLWQLTLSPSSRSEVTHRVPCAPL